MLNSENKKDKERRFEKMKATELDHSHNEENVTKVAAKEELDAREMERRSKGNENR
jgi:hypothetical protein